MEVDGIGSSVTLFGYKLFGFKGILLLRAEKKIDLHGHGQIRFSALKAYEKNVKHFPAFSSDLP